MPLAYDWSGKVINWCNERLRVRWGWGWFASVRLYLQANENDFHIHRCVCVLVCPNNEVLLHIKHNEANLNLMEFGFHTACRTHTYMQILRVRDTHMGLFFC